MQCYQVKARFAFVQGKPALVSTFIKQANVKPFLVLSCLPFGHGLKQSRFFETEKEAQGYAAHLHKVYAHRTVSESAANGGQLLLF